MICAMSRPPREAGAVACHPRGSGPVRSSTCLPVELPVRNSELVLSLRSPAQTRPVMHARIYCDIFQQSKALPLRPPRSTISTRASYSRFPINKMSRRTRLAAHGSISSSCLYPISKYISHRRTPSVRGGRKHRQFFPYLHCSSIERGQQGGDGLTGNGRGSCDADPDERSRCVGDAGAMDNGLVPREGPLDGLWWASARSSEQRGGCVGVREARICHFAAYNR